MGYIKQDPVISGGISLGAKVISIHIIGIGTLLSHIAVIILSGWGSIFPETDTFQSILGTCAEIIAGLYGITLAGYTFFLSRIDSLSASDMTLDYIVTSVKDRYKKVIWFISFNVVMTLFISIVLMYAPIPEQDSHIFIYRVICNEFLLFTCNSILWIVYYSISVINPNCMEKEAEKLKKRISHPVGKPGSTAEYIALYDAITSKCNAMISENVLDQIHENKGKRFSYTIALLQELRPVLRPLIGDLIRVHRYYECMINCRSLSVTREMCQLARHILTVLEEEEKLHLKPHK